jgi:hypothetical protein
MRKKQSQREWRRDRIHRLFADRRVHCRMHAFPGLKEMPSRAGLRRLGSRFAAARRVCCGLAEPHGCHAPRGIAAVPSRQRQMAPAQTRVRSHSDAAGLRGCRAAAAARGQHLPAGEREAVASSTRTKVGRDVAVQQHYPSVSATYQQHQPVRNSDPTADTPAAPSFASIDYILICQHRRSPASTVAPASADVQSP